MFKIILLIFTVGSLSGCVVTTKTYNKALDNTRQITLERNALDKKATEYKEGLANAQIELKQCSEENTKLQERIAEVDRIEAELKLLKQKVDDIKYKAQDIIDTINAE